MTKNQLLTEIYQSRKIAEVIGSIKPKHLQDDIKQHCFLELFEKSEEFILDLHSRGKLNSYILRVIYYVSRFSKNNSFQKHICKEILTDEFNQDVECEIYEEININPVLDSIYWYKSELIRLYAEHGTYQKVSDLTGIPLKSVYTTIIEARKEIKKKYHES